MKKFLISTFLSVACLSSCVDANGMQQTTEQQGQSAVLSVQDFLKVNDINTLINLLSEAGDKYSQTISNLRKLIRIVVDRGITGPLYPNYPHQVFCEVVA